MNPAVVSCNIMFVLSEIWSTGLSDCCLPESLTKMFLKRLFQIVTMHKSRRSYEVFPSNGYQHICATPSDISAKDVWTNSVWTDPPPHLASIRKSRETVKFALCCKVLYLCPPQWHRCFLSSSLFPLPILPESSRKYSWLKGARWDSSFARKPLEHLALSWVRMWERQIYNGMAAKQRESTNENRGKRYFKLNVTCYKYHHPPPPPRVPPLSTIAQTAQPWNR